MTNGSRPQGRSRGTTGERIKAALAKAEISQAEAARRLGIAQQNMQLICAGTHVPAFGVAVELARLLKRDLSEIVDLDEVAARWREDRDARAASALKARRAKRTK